MTGLGHRVPSSVPQTEPEPHTQSWSRRLPKLTIPISGGDPPGRASSKEMVRGRIGPCRDLSVEHPFGAVIWFTQRSAAPVFIRGITRPKGYVVNLFRSRWCGPHQKQVFLR